MAIESKDLIMLKQQITKALENNNNLTILDLLDQLATWNATTDSLKSSRIGVFVTELRKAPNTSELVKQKSKELVLKWKKDIGKATTSHTPQKKSINTNVNVISDTTKSDLTSANSSNPSTPKTPIERTCEGDNVFVKKLPEKVRVKCIEMLYSALATGTNEESYEVLNIAEEVESKVFDDNKSTNNTYKSRMRSLVANLRDKGNPLLKMRVVSGNIKPREFASMTPEDMMSKDRKALVEAAAKEAMSDAVTAKTMHAETDMFKCGKCKGRRATYYQMQTRSADEPMTTFVTCTICYNRWKFC
ncbi:transcription factor S-II, central domain-containing protein [Globomyces pollinis-pini]|nr:transcription factor S-II, central domain-containing protein [Globomyces pollinis-pini]